MTIKTTTVRWLGRRTKAYAERIAGATVVRVYDPIAGHYTVCHSLTAGQIRRVIGITLTATGA